MLDIYSQAAWNRRIVEPVKRNKDGLRWVAHRFEIKGGISLRDAMIIDISAPNPILAIAVAA